VFNFHKEIVIHAKNTDGHIMQIADLAAFFIIHVFKSELPTEDNFNNLNITFLNNNSSCENEKRKLKNKIYKILNIT
jgi:hypothetical protein